MEISSTIIDMNIFCINDNRNKKLQKKLTLYMNPKGHKWALNL